MSSQQAPDLDAVIVGAGFSGLYMLYRMRDVLGGTLGGLAMGLLI